MEVLGAGDVNEDVAEGLDGVRVPSEHHVGKPNVVVGGEVGGHDTGKYGLFGKLDVIKCL